MTNVEAFERVAKLLRAQGYEVIGVKGWRTRGFYEMRVNGFVAHHTASAKTAGNKPSLPICIYGRSDLDGPLCNFHLARNGTIRIVAAESANHAGEGGWQGNDENSEVIGVEWENNGVGEDATPEALKAYRALAAACALVFEFPAANICFHKEWAPTRKIDPYAPNFPSGDKFRAQAKELKQNNLQEELELNDADKDFIRNRHAETRNVVRKQNEQVLAAVAAVAEELETVAVKVGALSAKERERFTKLRDRIAALQQELAADTA